MAFSIMDLLSEARGEAPAKLTTTFTGSKRVYPSTDELATQSEPESTTVEPIKERQTPKKCTVEKHSIPNHPPHMLAAPEKHTTAKDATEKPLPQTTVTYHKSMIMSKKPLAKALSQANSETRLKEPHSQDMFPTKRRKATPAARKHISRLPKATGTGTQEGSDDDDFGDPMQMVRFSERAPADWKAQAEEEAKKLTAGIPEENRSAQLRAVGIDTGAGGTSKKRSYEEFEITEDTDLAELAMKGVVGSLYAKFEPEPVPHPAAKKMKKTSGKAGVPLVAEKNDDKEVKYSNKEVEHKTSKKPGRKPISRTVSKTTTADEKAEGYAAKRKRSKPKNPAMNRNLAKVLKKAKGGNLPVMGGKITAAQMAARKAARN